MTRTVALLLDDEFEDATYRVPIDRLRAAGHAVQVLGRRGADIVTGRRNVERVTIDAAVEGRDPEQFDALFIPGGHAPDLLRIDPAVIDFVRRFCFSGKPVAAICHGPQLLIEADVVKQHRVTSWPSVRTDLKNAGAIWEDGQVVEDPPFITAREPADLDALMEALLAKLGPAAPRASDG